MKKLLSISLFALFSILFANAQDAKTSIKSAKKHIKEKNHAEAVKHLTDAIAYDKNLLEAYKLRVSSLEALDKKEEMYADYKVISALEPKVKINHFNAGKLAYEFGDYKASADYMSKAIALDKVYHDAIKFRVKSNVKLENFTEAEVDNTKALSIAKDAENYFYQGVIALGLNKLTLAEEALINCGKIQENYPKVYTELAKVRVAKKSFDKAIATIDRAIKDDPYDKEAYYVRANANALQSKKAEAVKDITAWINLKSDDAEAYRKRATYHIDMNNTLEAKKDLTRAISLNENYMEAISDRAHVYEMDKDSKLASKDYETILRMEAQNDAQKILKEDAVHRLFDLNRESVKPEIHLVSPTSEDGKTIQVIANQTSVEIKIQVNDDSKVDYIRVNEKNIDFDKEKKNPMVSFKDDIRSSEFLRIEVADVYNNKNAVNYVVKQKQLTAPKIRLTEPYASSNGETYIEKDRDEIFIEGNIAHSEKIAQIKVNGINASFLNDKTNPSFTAKIQIKDINSFDIEVEDIYGTKGFQKFTLVRTDVSDDNPMGKTWVIFIENSNYKSFNSLEGPTKDINLIKSSLQDYSINRIIHKKDMTKEQLEKFFAIELRDLVKSNRINSLMVWYAGHGKFVNETGYWIPVDANRDDEYSYYNLNTLRAAMQAYDNILVHNLVITDACESGPSFYLAMRDTPKERICGDWEATKLRSAQVLSSAGYELAVDNSQFTKTFAAMLQHNPDNCISIEKISVKVEEVVSQSGLQKPKLGKIKGLTDQNGTFFFIKK